MESASAHGTRSRYNAGCDCAKCRRANTAYMHAHSLRSLTKKELRDKLATYRGWVEAAEKELAARG